VQLEVQEAAVPESFASGAKDFKIHTLANP